MIRNLSLLCLLCVRLLAQVNPAVQQAGNSITVVTRSGDLNVGPKLAGVETLRERLLGTLQAKLAANPPDLDLRTEIDQMSKLSAYCSKLAGLVETQKTNAQPVTYWLQANASLLKGLIGMYAGGKPFTEFGALEALARLESFQRSGFDGRLGQEIQNLRNIAANPTTVDQWGCASMTIRARSGYTSPGTGIAVFSVDTNAASVPAGTPVVVHVAVTMAGEGDCLGQNVTFSAAELPPGAAMNQFVWRLRPGE